MSSQLRSFWVRYRVGCSFRNRAHSFIFQKQSPTLYSRWISNRNLFENKQYLQRNGYASSRIWHDDSFEHLFTNLVERCLLQLNVKIQMNIGWYLQEVITDSIWSLPQCAFLVPSIPFFFGRTQSCLFDLRIRFVPDMSNWQPQNRPQYSANQFISRQFSK